MRYGKNHTCANKECNEIVDIDRIIFGMHENIKFHKRKDYSKIFEQLEIHPAWRYWIIDTIPKEQNSSAHLAYNELEGTYTLKIKADIAAEGKTKIMLIGPRYTKLATELVEEEIPKIKAIIDAFDFEKLSTKGGHNLHNE